MPLRINNNPTSVNALRNLSRSHDALSKSLERLSSGEKINHGSDGPANLIISENLRSQISGIEQAIENSEFSISMVQTAEGALTEVNNLLIEVRQLGLAAANEGANDINTLQALQSQLDNALASIDRVSANTRFGNKPLLDGSNSTIGVTNNSDLHFVSAAAETEGSPLAGYTVEVSKAASKAVGQTKLTNDLVKGLTLSISEGANSLTVIAGNQETADSFSAKIQKAAEQNNLDIDVSYDKPTGNLVVQHKEYGEDASFMITSSKDGVFSQAKGISEYKGQDIEGTINGESAKGKGRILRGNEGNPTTGGLAVEYTGTQLGKIGSVTIRQNALTFHVGPNEGETVRIALDNTSASSLGRNIDNKSGFKSLAEVDVTTAQGAQDTIRFADQAINQLTSIRGKLGAFQKNSLESNIATLQVTAENLIAAESTIRDTDIAAELAEFTKNKILTETASAAVAQASDVSRRSLVSLLQEI